jgi:hypothetical protein
MARYREALGLFDCELPLGWRLNIEASTLLRVQFCWWRGEAHKLGVQLIPSVLPAESDDRQWFEALSRAVEPAALRPQTLLRQHGRTIAIGRQQAAAPDIEHKFIYVRGAVHDVALHELAAPGQTPSALDGDAVLNELTHGILSTLRLAAEHRPQRAPVFAELMTLAANAFKLADSINPAAAGALGEAANAARALVEACLDVILSQLCCGRTPPMMAACNLADGKLILWQAERADPTLLKDARTIVRRVCCAYAEELAQDAKSRTNVEDLEARVVQAEAELVAPRSPDEYVAADAFQRGRRRARWGTDRASSHLAAGRADAAEICLHDAVDDLAQALAVPIPKRRIWVSDELVAALQAYSPEPSHLALLVAFANQ